MAIAFNALRALLAGAAALALLAGCAVRPAPLTDGDTVSRVTQDRRALAANRPVLEGPLTLHRAMAYALLFNLERRVRTMEQALALGELEAARRGLLPGLSARSGATTRGNVQASSSLSILTGLESLSASTSTDRTTRTGSLTAVWHALDFGVSYFAARQQSDRVLIAHERRRKAAQTVLAEVRRAWWRAAAAERALQTLAPLMARVKAALADSARMAELGVRSPLAALRYRRALLRARRDLERQRRDGRRTRLELAGLIGLGPEGRDRPAYRLALPAESLPPRDPVLDAAALEVLALRQRPELREAQLSERIAAAEVRKALLRMLPGIDLNAGAEFSSNSFLVNNDWATLGAQVSLNLSQWYTAPAAMAAARAGRTLERARREAAAMAVLTQLYVALAELGEARAQHATASQIAETQDGIVATLRSGARLGVADELEATLAELEAVQTALTRDLAYAAIEDGFGRVFAAVGADIVVDGAPVSTPEDLAAVIAAAEAGWMRGEVAMQRFPERRTKSDGL
ncbi:MAG: TolC family protein [Deltaproteobacteria bacterium]|nr:TolC family protein [Deltaproteobacteria bacterium]